MKEQFPRMLLKLLLIFQIVPFWFPFILCLKGGREPKNLFLKNRQAYKAWISDGSSRPAFLLLCAVRGLGGRDAGRPGGTQPELAMGSPSLSTVPWHRLPQLSGHRVISLVCGHPRSASQTADTQKPQPRLFLHDVRIQSNEVLSSQFMNEEAAWAAPCVSLQCPRKAGIGSRGAVGTGVCRGRCSGPEVPTWTSVGREAGLRGGLVAFSALSAEKYIL